MTTTRTVPYREYAKATDEVLALRAEVERLQREIVNLQRDVLDEHDANRRVLEEAERLRAALEEIKDAYRKIGEAPNSDIRALARAHLFTVLNQVCET
jgi:chromosome segregation ATPase